MKSSIVTLRTRQLKGVNSVMNKLGFMWGVALACGIGFAPITVSQPSASPEIRDRKTPSTTKLTVGVAGEPPGVLQKTGQNEDEMFGGVTVQIWDLLANELDLDYELVYYPSVSDVLDHLEKQQIDVAIGSITVTDDAIVRFDFTQPMAQDTLTILVPSQLPTPWSIIRPFLGWGFLSSVGLISLNIFVVGTLLWLAERDKNSEQFPKPYFIGIAMGMWCALVTFTTVGYGDRYPQTPWGRAIAGAWMLVSLAVVTTLTAGIASTFGLAFSAKPAAGINQPGDINNMRVAAIRDSAAVQWARYYQARVTEVEHVDDAIALLEKKEVDGFIFSRLGLEHYLQEHPKKPLKIVGFNLGAQSYGFALTPNSPLTRQLNEAIASVETQIRLHHITENWLGPTP
ncbi:MAG: transporter substrate-binding domain-containing protein [Cyanobacteria bacterium P01_H01_bin.15]